MNNYSVKTRWTLADYEPFEDLDEIEVKENGKFENWRMSWLCEQVEVYSDDNVSEFIARHDNCQSPSEFFEYMAEFGDDLHDDEREVWTAFVNGTISKMYTLVVSSKPENLYFYFFEDADIQEILKEGLDFLLCSENATLVNR